ncbi:alpha/beta hydrolase [Saccharopolyspora sp. NFXS83]|uniref:alpha/beta hydrolase n=1 Tax=Saccharopolyspora sp. NFXS83 TaxID=2993560 RepID=UPI00224B7209|nr:alpha/beta hydrolase [Saccharopolyspora sp. NFXS83]MCX2729315.1 alpha/beta hydrolase [Saccharopolyspora sp. NFXS83]
MRKFLLWMASGAAVAAAATAVVPTVSAASTATDELNWGPCPTTPVPTPDLECTTLRVPLDYQDPGGRKVEIAVSRLPSKNPEQRRGVLLTNPGGPGGGGLDYPQLLTESVLPKPLPPSVRDQYDVIGFDPRGVGHSAPVTCDLTPEQIAIGNLPYAHDSADVVRQAEVSKAEAEQCANSATGSTLPFITTANTARDMDAIREALGESTASYLGASYGSYLGAVYTTMFPERSDRVVLDSNLGPNGYDIGAMRAFGRGMEERFPDFARFAAARPDYGLGTTPDEVTAKFDELADRLDREPVAAYNGTVFRGLTFSLLYSADLEPLAKAWQALDEGEDPELPGSEPPASDNVPASRFAVICGDSAWPRSVESYQRDVEADRERYPKLGAASANISPCAFWADPAEPKVRITDRGPSNVLLVQNERDPGTPMAGARELRSALGDRARMVSVDEGGHGVYVVGANQCANDAVTDFLTTGARPERDSSCAPESR